MKLAPAPRLRFERADPGRDRPILIVEGIQVGDADAEARVVRPVLVVVHDEIEGYAVALDAGHAIALPENGEAHVVRVEAERLRQTAAGGNQGSDGVEGGLHRCDVF